MTTAVTHITPCPPGFSDHTFKVAHGVSIPLRIWPASTDTPDNAPWLFWLHGGGFQAGKHYIPNAWVYEAFHSRGYHIISAAYRYIPHVALPEIVEDCTDAFKWCRDNLPEILGAGKVNIDSYVVAGDSAGGTLSTILGHMLEPRAKVVIDVFGVVDMADQHFYTRAPPPFDSPKYHKAKDEDELKVLLSDRDPSKAEIVCPWHWELEPEMKVEDLQSFWGVPGYTPETKDFLRMDGLNYLNAVGERMTMLLRKDECKGEEEFKERQRKWSSLALLDGIEGGGKGYPPTFILHGTGDHAVPVEQSYRFEKRLKEVGIPVEAVYCPGGEHSFENKIEGPQDDGWKEYIIPCMEFVDRYVKS